MTEAEWAACGDPEPMLAALVTPNYRRVRLFACACCWRIAHHMTDAGRQSIETVERFVDEPAAQDELSPVLLSLQLKRERHYGESFDAGAAVLFALRVWDGVRSAVGASKWAAIAGTDAPAEWAAQAGLVRCIFRRASLLAFGAAWRTDTVLALAHQMYDSRDFSAMPILADALQDAGCDSADVFDHCRNDGPHARGCWVVDLVLGKG